MKLLSRCLNSLSANPTKLSKHFQIISRQQPTNCLNVYNHFLGFVLKGLNVTESLQLCVGQGAVGEEATQAVYEIFYEEDTEAFIMIDASNAFSSINAATPTDLHIQGVRSINLKKGITQGDLITMTIYAIRVNTSSWMAK